jgi:transposase IS66 family protein
VFTAEEPEGMGPEKYDETAAAMIAQLQHGSGIPFYRLERLEEQLGIPLAAATQWEMVEEAAEVIKPARDELIRQAAQGEVLHNDDTGMKVRKLEREPGGQRTGVFTSGIVSTAAGRQIALYFTGRQHAGENIADVLKQRAAESGAAIQMCDALSWSAPKLPDGVGVAGGALPRPWTAADGRSGAELSRRVPARAGKAGRGLPERCGDAWRISSTVSRSWTRYTARWRRSLPNGR